LATVGSLTLNKAAAFFSVYPSSITDLASASRLARVNHALL